MTSVDSQHSPSYLLDVSLHALLADFTGTFSHVDKGTHRQLTSTLPLWRGMGGEGGRGGGRKGGRGEGGGGREEQGMGDYGVEYYHIYIRIQLHFQQCNNVQ